MLPAELAGDIACGRRKLRCVTEELRVIQGFFSITCIAIPGGGNRVIKVVFTVFAACVDLNMIADIASCGGTVISVVTHCCSDLILIFLLAGNDIDRAADGAVIEPSMTTTG